MYFSLPNEISFSFKKTMANLLTGYVQIQLYEYTKLILSHMVVHLDNEIEF